MKNDRIPLAAALASAILALAACGNDTGNGEENESGSASALRQSPTAGFGSASEIVIPSASPLFGSPAADAAEETLAEEELAEELGSLWGPITKKSPSASPSAPSNTDDKNASTDDKNPASSPKNADEKQANTRYRSGEYIATGTYLSPAGPEAIRVELVVQDNMLTNVIVTPLAKNETSLKMQQQFAEDIGLEVTGRPLEEITSLGAVNGSSLASEGFLDALAKIREEAAL